MATTAPAGECAGRLPPGMRGARPLDAAPAMTEKRRMEVDELRARCRRLVLDGDDDRRADRAPAPRGRPAGTGRARDQAAARRAARGWRPRGGEGAPRRDGARRSAALEEAAELAEWIYPAAPRGGSAWPRRCARQRSARDSCHRSRSRPQGGYQPEAGERSTRVGSRRWTTPARTAAAMVTVRAENGRIAFEVVADGDRSAIGFERLRDRVEALGGRLMVESEPGGGTRISGSLRWRSRRYGVSAR